MLPKRALKKSQLTILTDSNTVQDGSHQISKAEFVEDGVKYKGFFKKLATAKDFPDFLAKLSVAASFFKRTFQGKRSAEERLVFDEDERLVGTFSIEVPGFKPLKYANETAPREESERLEVIPSTQKLIEANIIELLFGRWYLNDDDGHPHNISLQGDIDFDMFWYYLSIYIKEPRLIVGIPNMHLNLTVKDWERFPAVEDAKPFHWPTYTHPGQESLPNILPSIVYRNTLPKLYADPGAFTGLAGNMKAQDQKMAAAMKILLTYQPEMMRKRLEDLFGNLKLNYTALEEKDPNLPKTFEKTFPKLFNKQTNGQTFVDFIMNLYQNHYDNLYRVVVFYKGCDNNGYGAALPPTAYALYQKPSYFTDVKNWVAEQNNSAYAKDVSTHKFDMNELDNRYHQIWRDASAPSIIESLHSSYKLTNELLKKVSTESSNIEVVRRPSNDNSVTSVWEMFVGFPEISVMQIQSKLKVHHESPLYEAVILLAKFTADFYTVSKEYYTKDRKNLTTQDNDNFCKKLRRLLDDNDVDIREKLKPLLGNTTTYADQFNAIAKELEQHISQANLRKHLTTNDEMMRNAYTVSPSFHKPRLALGSDELKKEFNTALFHWAKMVEPHILTAAIMEVVTEHYASPIAGIRVRAEPVKKYLNSSENVSGDIRLSYILSSGNEDGSGTLNTNLIKYLPHKMLPTAGAVLNPIQTAIGNNEFAKHIDAYTLSAVAFAKKDPRFVHICSDKGAELFFKAFYYWVEKLSPNNFKTLMNNSLTIYKSGLAKNRFGFSTSTSRESEITGYMDTYKSQKKIVGMSFTRGQDTSTFNTTLFNQIIEGIKSEMAKKQRVLPSELADVAEGFKLINQYQEEWAPYYFRTPLFNKLAKENSAIIENAPSNSNSAFTNVV